MAVIEHRTRVLPYQKEILCNKHKYLAVYGGLGSAKTRAANLVAHDWCTGYNNKRFSYWSETYGKLMDSVRADFDTLLDEMGYIEGEHYTYSKGKKIYYFDTGSELHLMSMDVASSKIKGPEWDGILWDEADTGIEEKWMMLKNRVRGEVQPGLIRVFGNSVPPLHWFARCFEGVDQMPEHSSMHITSYQNPFLTDDDIRDLEATYPPHSTAWKRWMMGQNVALEGAIFFAYDPERHLFDKIPKNLSHAYGLDLGNGGANHDPTVLITGGISGEGKIYITDAWMTDQTGDPVPVQLQAENIKQLVETPFVFSDHSLNMRTAFLHEGIETILATKDVTTGLALVNKLFINGYLYIKRGEPGTALAYLNQCLQQQIYKPNSIKDEPDHAFSDPNDALRYLCMGIYGEQGFDLEDF